GAAARKSPSPCGPPAHATCTGAAPQARLALAPPRVPSRSNTSPAARCALSIDVVASAVQIVSLLGATTIGVGVGVGGGSVTIGGGSTGVGGGGGGGGGGKVALPVSIRSISL